MEHIDEQTLNQIIENTPFRGWNTCVSRLGYDKAQQEHSDTQPYIDMGCYLCSGNLGPAANVASFCTDYKSIKNIVDSRVEMSKNLTGYLKNE